MKFLTQVWNLNFRVYLKENKNFQELIKSKPL